MAPPNLVTGLRNGWRLVTASGEVTADTRSALRNAFAAAAGELPFVVADISALDFRAPADFEPLAFGRRTLRRAEGQLLVVHPSEVVGYALDALVDDEFPVFGDIERATRRPPPH
ncbi:hypothetical protein [Yinghuangia sp. YIM S09857]|uniref:hypothetical protein n=1 Tax=Yinghuangia sp. YIM S09857 TaxID=3436929 RepID=UPI003F53A3A6